MPVAQPPPGLPPGRYDPPPAHRPAVVALVAVLVATAALVAAYLLYTRYEAGRLGAALRSYTVVSDSLVRITFEVDKKATTRAECKVRARDRTGQETGSALVEVGSERVVTYDLATRARAATGELIGCRRR